MTRKLKALSVNIPFAGFYESLYSSAIDSEEERFIEYRTEDNGETGPDYESHWPEPLRLDAGEYADILYWATNYPAAYRTLAGFYVDAFDVIAGKTLGMSVGARRRRYQVDTRKFYSERYRQPSIRLTFEEMTSPREYNFETDRLFARLPAVVIRRLFKLSRDDNHETLAAVIAERFTHRSGFVSFYSNDLAEWLDKPLMTWDHNEIGTLLIAVLRLRGFDPSNSDDSERLYYAATDGEGAYTAWEKAVDWQQFESKRAEKRADKLADWIKADPHAANAWIAANPEDATSITAKPPKGLDDSATGTA